FCGNSQRTLQTSYLPWFEVYYKLLNTLADYLTKELENDLNVTLQTLYNHPVPKANTPVNLSVNQEIFIASEQVLKDQPFLASHSCFIAPDVSGLPTIPESRNLTEYFVAVDVNNMLHLYASMLHERRIIITSSKLSTLTACVHGSVALLYPMFWQHIYIPVLPPHLLDYCCAPMPYVIGIHSSLTERVKNKSLEDVVMLNVDTNALESPFNDLNNLPSDVVSALKNKLKKQSTATGDGVARAFVRAQAALFGSYRDALRYKPGEPITFCEESFVKHRSSPMKQFLETAVNLQLFKQFIDGRLAKLNAGRGFSDVFEEEITSGGFSGGNPRSYQQWVHTVKKGGALFNSAVTKASPAVRTAYKFAKSHAKQGIREVKSKLKHKENEDDYGPYASSVQYTPVYTLHSEKGGSVEKRKLTQARSRRPLKSPEGALCDHEDDDMERASKLSSEDGEEASAYFYESDDSAETRGKAPYSGEMDLLGEILDTLSTHSSDQGKLAAAKSLDFFRSMDDIDYKPTNACKGNITCTGLKIRFQGPVMFERFGTASVEFGGATNLGGLSPEKLPAKSDLGTVGALNLVSKFSSRNREGRGNSADLCHHRWPRDIYRMQEGIPATLLDRRSQKVGPTEEPMDAATGHRCGPEQPPVPPLQQELDACKSHTSRGPTGTSRF
ncbi:DENN domain-containing protein 1B, partial [Pteropus vampyrus]|uniref:DENN domain-containing protein 1B n=1 Tax=Pteropus vampyrus TaxID=132908 RepID=A0A6P6CTB1_PTEVA